MKNPIVWALVGLMSADSGLGCGDGKGRGMAPAFAVHMRAVGVYEATRPALDSAQMLLAALDTEMQETGPVTAPAAVARLEALKQTYDRLAAADSAVRNWPAQLVEVPGFEDPHDHTGHDHAHDHTHDPLSDLPPAEMLALQEVLLARITTAADSLQAVSHHARHLLTTWAVEE